MRYLVRSSRLPVTVPPLPPPSDWLSSARRCIFLHIICCLPTGPVEVSISIFIWAAKSSCCLHKFRSDPISCRCRLHARQKMPSVVHWLWSAASSALGSSEIGSTLRAWPIAGPKKFAAGGWSLTAASFAPGRLSIASLFLGVRLPCRLGTGDGSWAHVSSALGGLLTASAGAPPSSSLSILCLRRCLPTCS